MAEVKRFLIVMACQAAGDGLHRISPNGVFRNGHDFLAAPAGHHSNPRYMFLDPMNVAMRNEDTQGGL